MADLRKVVFTYPAIDNHCHPLLQESHRNAVQIDGVLSEATGAALTEDAVHTLAGYRATKHLSRLYSGLSDRYTWEEIKEHRTGREYEELCRQNFEPAHIQCLLIDDGLRGVEEMCERYTWHDQFTSSPSKRIVRVEVIAEVSFSLQMDQYSNHDLESTARVPTRSQRKCTRTVVRLGHCPTPFPGTVRGSPRTVRNGSRRRRFQIYCLLSNRVRRLPWFPEHRTLGGVRGALDWAEHQRATTGEKGVQ